MFPPRVSIFFCFLVATKHICRTKRSSSTKNNSFEFSTSVSSFFSPLSKTTHGRNIASLWPRMFQDFPARSRTFLFVGWKEPLAPCFPFFLFPPTALFPPPIPFVFPLFLCTTAPGFSGFFVPRSSVFRNFPAFPSRCFALFLVDSVESFLCAAISSISTSSHLGFSHQ